VVIEAGASAFAIDFTLVQPEISTTTRVCSYDRAGSGWSDPRPDVEIPIRVIRDLRSVLNAAGEKPPFVMVGASRGGVFVRLFQAEYVADVAGHGAASAFVTAILTIVPTIQFSGLLQPVSTLKGGAGFIGSIWPASYYMHASLGAYTKGLGLRLMRMDLLFLACSIPVLLAISWLGLKKQER